MTTQLRPDVERVRGRLSGLIPPERIRVVDFSRVPGEIIQGFREIEGPTSIVSDVLDSLGINGVIPASVLRPILPDVVIVGTAFTIRYEPEQLTHTQGRLEKKKSGLAHADACILCQPGDIMVIDAGGVETSVTGDLAALNAQKAGFVGNIVDGGIRDADTIRKIGYPIWSRHVTPQSGRLRMDAVEINGVVSVGGVRVEPGDLIIADGAGIAVVPHHMAERVLKEAQAIVAKEAQAVQDIQRGQGADWQSILGGKKG